MVHKLDLNEADHYQHSDDIRRIMQIALARGVVLSAHEAAGAWQENSDNMCAGWLCLPANDDSVWLELPAWARGLQGE